MGNSFPVENTNEGLAFRDLFDRNPIPMWVLDEETKQVLYANTAALKRYGYTIAEITHKTIFDLCTTEERDRLRLWLSARKTEFSGSMGYWRHQAKNGTLLSVEVFQENVQWAGAVGFTLCATGCNGAGSRLAGATRLPGRIKPLRGSYAK